MDAVEQNFMENEALKSKTNRLLSKIGAMAPDERKVFMGKWGMKESDIHTMSQEIGQGIEKGPQGAESSFSDMLMMAFTVIQPVTMIISGILGAGAGAGTKALTGSEPIAELIDTFTNFATLMSGQPAAAEKIMSKYGVEAGPKIIEAMKGIGTEEQGKLTDAITKLTEFMKGGGELPAGMKLDTIPKELHDLFFKIPEEPVDIALRSLKNGSFLNHQQTEDLVTSAFDRVKRLSSMLEFHLKLPPELQDLHMTDIAQEFLKFAQLQSSMVVEKTTKAGKAITQLIKKQLTPEDLNDLSKVISDGDFPKILKGLVDNVGNSILSNQKGFLDMQPLWTFAKSALTSRNIYKAEINAQLSNPRIPITKIMTDVMNITLNKVSQAVGIGVENKSFTVGQKELLASYHGFRQNVPEAWKIMKAVFKSEQAEFEIGLGIKEPMVYGAEGIDHTLQGLSHSWLGSLMSVGTRGILAADQGAKLLAYRMELHTQAYYKALEEAESAGIVGMQKLRLAGNRAAELVSESPDWLIDAAETGMYKQTFTHQNVLLQRINSFLKEYPSLRILFPYTTVPFNLAARGIELTPLGLLNPEIWQGTGLARSAALARTAAGSTLSAYIWHEAVIGNITGSGPRNPLVRDAWRKTHEPNSIYIAGRPFTYKHLGPFALYLGLIADAASIYTEADPADKGAIADAIFVSLAKNAANLPMLDELTRLEGARESVARAKMSGEDASFMTKAWNDFAGEEVAGFIPAPIKLAAQISDPIYHDAHGIIDTIKEKIPGYSSTVPPKTYFDGTPQYAAPGVSTSEGPPTPWEAAISQLSPIGLPEVHEMDDLDKEIARLQPSFSRTPDFISQQGAHVPITPQDQYDWSKTTGNIDHNPDIADGKDIRTFMSETINSPDYQDASKFYKKARLEQIHTQFKSAAKETIIPRYQVELQRTLAESDFKKNEPDVPTTEGQ